MTQKKLIRMIWTWIATATLVAGAGWAQDPPPVQTTPTETVPLEQMFAISTDDPSQVLTESTGNKYISDETASTICGQFGSRLATGSQMQTAYEAGAAYCTCGITANGGAFPMQVQAEGCGIAGVVSCGPGWTRNLAYCWGSRPTASEVTAKNSQYKLQRFGGSWSQYCASSSDPDCQPEVERPIGEVFPAGPIPANLYSQFPDDELAWWASNGSSNNPSPQQALLTTNSSVTSVQRGSLPGTLPTPAGYSSGSPASSPPVLLTKGRFVSQDADQLVAMTKTGGYATTNACYSFTYTIEGWLDSSVGSAEFPTSTLTPCLASRGNWWLSPFALAGGDLDRAVDDEGHFHDELVVAYENGNAGVDPPGSVVVAVFDYSAGNGSAAKTEYTFPTSNPYNRLSYPNGSPGLLEVATFADDGTGRRKIAVVHSTSSTVWGDDTVAAYGIDILGYTPASSGQAASLEPLASYSVSLAKVSAAGIDLMSGDFNGDGLGEVAFLRPAEDADAGSGWKLMFFSYAEDTQGIGRVVRLADHKVDGDFTANAVTARLAAGTFHFDPANGYDLGRQQIAVAQSLGSNLQLRTYTVDGAFGVQSMSTYSMGINGSQFDLAAGGYSGVDADPANPITGLALGYAAGSNLVVDYLAGDTLQRTARSSVPANGADITSLMAFDVDGDSLVLGAPVSFVADAPTQVYSILEQPPQHLDYLPNETGANDSGLLDVSRDPNFALTFSQESSSAINSQQQSSNSWNVGASGSASASFTLTERVPLIEKGTLKGGLAGRLGYTHGNSSTSTAGTQSTFSYEMSESPVNEDALYVTMQRFQIWRYRIYGAETTDPDQPYGYYEVYSPEGIATTGWYGASTIDAYQPIHENGNVLSYPDIYEGQPSSPPDLGKWSPTQMPPDCDAPPPPDFSGYSTPLTGTGNHVLTVSGVQQTLKVQLDQTQTCDNQRSTSNTLQGGIDFNARITLKENEFFAQEEEKGAFNVKITGGDSWGDMSAMNSVNSSSANLAISTVALGDTDWSYTFMPVAYISANGTFEVDFYASLPGSQQNWWKTTYSGADPALNLPLKYVSADGGETWTFNTALDAQKLRGFFLRDGSQTGSNGLGPLLGEVPAEGDQVQVEVRVSNYSAMTQVADLPVRFDIARYDGASDSVSDRQVLGTVTAQYTDEAVTPGGPSLGTTFPPRGVGRATYTIDTRQLDLAPGINDFVVYAVLNPGGDAPQKETHGWRSPNVFVTPYTKGRENVGATVTLAFEDPSGTALGSVSITSGGDPPTDILELVDAVNASDLAATYGFQAYAFPEQTPQTQPEKLVLAVADSVALPSPTSFVASLQLPSAVGGVTAVQVLPSVSGQGSATVTASNLEPGQNNSGYGFLSVAAPTSQGQALVVSEDGLGVVDSSGRLVTASAQVSVGDQVPARLCVSAPEGAYLGLVDVPIYSGDPEDGQGVAIKRLNGVDDQGSCTWFTWIPRQAGQQQLTAVLPDGSTDELTVTVSQ